MDEVMGGVTILGSITAGMQLKMNMRHAVQYQVYLDTERCFLAVNLEDR
ncbi:MAG: hypothetical protein P8K83_00560 [Woeseiaceae bacterium]|jgi:hypothetical protein|nr:hypothetical protein [Woeseiaceae bacterium]